MADPDGPVGEMAQTEPSATTGGSDLENQAPAGISNIISPWRTEDLIKKASLGLRAASLIFSLLAFIVMASNNHGDGKNFDQYDEYKYVLAIAILSSLYTGFQVVRQVHELSTGRQLLLWRHFDMFDFLGDQITSYLLISAASAAVPLTNAMREGADNIFTDSSATSISMEFLAFFALAISAVISGYRLAKQTYI